MAPTHCSSVVFSLGLTFKSLKELGARQSTIHLMLGKHLEKECMGSYGMLCVMRVLNEFEPKEATNMVTSPKCVK